MAGRHSFQVKQRGNLAAEPLSFASIFARSNLSLQNRVKEL